MSDGTGVTEAELHAYVDGQLDPTRRAAVEAYLAECPDEEARLAAYRRINDELRSLYGPVIGETVPASMLRPRRRRLRVALRAASIVGWVLLGGAVGWWAHPALSPDRAPLAALLGQAMAAHVVYTPEVRHPVEVGADQEQHLANWLSKRLDAQVRPPDLKSRGYRLMGGRLLPGGGEAAALFMYEDSVGRRLTLYVRKEAGGRDTAFRFARRDGLSAFYWIDRDLGYALTGRVDRRELLALAETVYRQLP